MRHPARAAGASLLRLQSDERLAELACAGHESAFDAIVDRYRTPLTRYCAGIVGPSRAEDAVQQALINAHDALQRTDEVRNLRSWLYRISHNAALNVLRTVRDEVPLDEADAAGRFAGAAGARAVEPAESFERSEQFRSTLAALQALPERQRAALVLRELEGRSHEEIAAALGVTKGSARQHLMRARVAVRSAVTAITPYPLVVRLADWASTSPGATGWVDTATTAGAGAGLAKLTAGLAATGALVGGAAVGTQHVLPRGDGAAAAKAATVAGSSGATRASQGSPKAVGAPLGAVTVARATIAAPSPSLSPGASGPRGRVKHATRPGALKPAAAGGAPTAKAPATEAPSRGAEDRHVRAGDGGERERERGRDDAHGEKPKPGSSADRPSSARDESDERGGRSEGKAKGKSDDAPGHRKDDGASKAKPEKSGKGSEDASGAGSGKSKDKDKTTSAPSAPAATTQPTADDAPPSSESTTASTLPASTPTTPAPAPAKPDDDDED